MQVFYFYLFCFLLLSCTGTKSHEPKLTFRDSVMQLYREETTVNRVLDTSDFNFSLLNAYIKNDSAALSTILGQINMEKESRKWRAQLDSCIKLTNLKDMDMEEGYRFEYDGGLCPLRQITTIYKHHDTIKLKFELYQLKWNDAQCIKLEEFDRVLTKKNWEEFLDKVESGDFWGLKSANKRSGLDGSTYYITGFKKATSILPSEYHFVHRWGHTSLFDAFEYATLLAANTKGCFWVRLKN